MSMKTVWERAKVEGKDLLAYVQRVIEQGNARRIVIKQKGTKIVEFPLTVGVVGAVLAPVLAAVGAIATLATECTIEIERTVPEAPKTAKPAGTKRKTTAQRSATRKRS
ncbi:MAG TPA: DUF4342 domain-containing protein [Planctomycetota bacterium]|jgi:hypothetical protein|nr:DUF4342 domain-containing protein [Planctomycetota bacterium]